jgi:hypothetical protein
MSAVHVSEVADVGHAAEFVRIDLGERCEHSGERRVDPHIDRSQLALDGVRGGRHGLVFGDVDRDRDRLAAGLLDVCRRTDEAGLTTR